LQFDADLVQFLSTLEVGLLMQYVFALV